MSDLTIDFVHERETIEIEAAFGTDEEGFSGVDVRVSECDDENGREVDE